jgi:hypothetical protein
MSLAFAELNARTVTKKPGSDVGDDELSDSGNFSREDDTSEIRRSMLAVLPVYNFLNLYYWLYLCLRADNDAKITSD